MINLILKFLCIFFSAEHFLQQVEANANYPVLLLSLVSRDDSQVPQSIKLAAAINLKNLVKRNWVVVSFRNSYFNY